MPPDEAARAAMLAELRRLREEVAWLKALPPGAVTVEGLVIEATERRPDPQTAVWTAWIRSSDRTWRIEQTDTGEGTPDVWKQIRIVREPDPTE